LLVGLSLDIEFVFKDRSRGVSTQTVTTSAICCPSCGKEFPHNVIYAASRVHHLRCSVCKDVNVFVLEEPAGAQEGDQERKVVPQEYAAVMERRGSKALCAYSTTGTYTEGQYIMHPKFGEGYVLAVRSPPVKMEVLFEDHNRMLVCGRGSIVGVPEEEDRESSQGEEVRPDERSRAAQPKHASAPLAGKEATRPPHDEPSKCPVCGCTAHPFNLARALDGRIVGCLRCR